MIYILIAAALIAWASYGITLPAWGAKKPSIRKFGPFIIETRERQK